MSSYLGAYLLLINAWTWLAFARDKRKAVKGSWRLSETYLLALAFLGGSVGAIMGMNMFRHKTAHLKFSWGLRLILLLQTAFVIYWYIIRW